MKWKQNRAESVAVSQNEQIHVKCMITVSRNGRNGNIFGLKYIERRIMRACGTEMIDRKRREE